MDKLILNKKEYLYLRHRIEHEPSLYEYTKMLDDAEGMPDGKVTIENPDPYLLRLLGPREG